MKASAGLSVVSPLVAMQAVAFVRGQCDEDWQKSNERGQFLDSLDLKWDSVASFADIDDKAESRTVLLGDALPRPGKSLASGAQVYNGSFPRQVCGLSRPSLADN